MWPEDCPKSNTSHPKPDARSSEFLKQEFLVPFLYITQENISSMKYNANINIEVLPKDPNGDTVLPIHCNSILLC